MNNSAIRGLLLLYATITVGFTSCNYTDGECWYYGEGSENAGVGVGPGGGVFIPTGPAGAGGFGDTPPQPPQDTANQPPDCNIVSLSPCHEKCDEEDEARAVECAKIKDEIQRKACQDSSHETYKSCRETCEQGATQSCDSRYQDCQNNAPFSCTNSIGGKSQCQRCWERCNAGDAPSATCRKCRF